MLLIVTIVAAGEYFWTLHLKYFQFSNICILLYRMLSYTERKASSNIILYTPVHCKDTINIAKVVVMAKTFLKLSFAYQIQNLIEQMRAL